MLQTLGALISQKSENMVARCERIWRLFKKPREWVQSFVSHYLAYFVQANNTGPYGLM